MTCCIPVTKVFCQCELARIAKTCKHKIPTNLCTILYLFHGNKVYYVSNISVFFVLVRIFLLL